MRKSIATALCLVALATGSAAQAEVQAQSHTVKSPRDASSGMATGKRMHKPFVIIMSWSSQADAQGYCSSVSGQFATTGASSSCTVDESSQAASDARALGCTSGTCPSSAPPLTVSKSTPKLMETCASGSSCASSSSTTDKSSPKLSTQACPNGASCASKTTTGKPMASDDWETPVVK